MVIVDHLNQHWMMPLRGGDKVGGGKDEAVLKTKFRLPIDLIPALGNLVEIKS